MSHLTISSLCFFSRHLSQDTETHRKELQGEVSVSHWIKGHYQAFLGVLIDLIIGLLVLIIKTFDDQTEPEIHYQWFDYQVLWHLHLIISDSSDIWWQNWIQSLCMLHAEHQYHKSSSESVRFVSYADRIPRSPSETWRSGMSYGRYVSWHVSLYHEFMSWTTRANLFLTKQIVLPLFVPWTMRPE